MSERKTYIGVTMIEAIPMDLGSYNIQRGWTIPPEEDPKTEGYFVVHEQRVNNESHITWVPKKQFEETYQEISTGCMSFGFAIEAMKKGLKVYRHGWRNEKLQYIFIITDADNKI